VERGTETVNVYAYTFECHGILAAFSRSCASMAKAREFMQANAKPSDLIFHSRRQGPLTEQTILVQGLYPALDRLGIERDGFQRCVTTATRAGNWQDLLRW